MAAARLTAALARVVQDAHDRGIIHRDLKPANVLAAGPADGPLEPAILKLTDFGLAKRLDGDNAASSLSSGLIVGTPSYMAPELATSRAAAAAAGPAVDIYGLGAILYEMLTGRPPFLGESPMETVVQVISSPPAAPSHFNSGVPDTLEAICLKCLAKDPMQRYPSARDLAAALDHCANEPARNAANRRRVMSKRISRACKLTTIASTLLVLAGLFGYFARRRQPSVPIVSAPRRAISLMGPPSGWFSQGQNYIEHGRVDLVPPLETVATPSKTISFDLSDHRHEQYLLAAATSNARIWEEHNHGIRYWGPIDDRKWFEVVYRLDVGFSMGAASLLAMCNLVTTDSEGIIEVSVDPKHGWMAPNGPMSPGFRNERIDISEIVRGSSIIYVRARLKGRDDHDGSAMAQFMRTSILPDGHLEVRAPNVFELRAYERIVPIVTVRLRFNDGWSRQLSIRDDGSFDFDRRFLEPGKYTGVITATATGVRPVSKTFDLWINSPGCRVNINSGFKDVHESDTFQARGKLEADGLLGPLIGVVDYGDGSGEQPLVVEPDRSFTLEHIYPGFGAYFFRITIRDSANHMATVYRMCNVIPRSDHGGVTVPVQH